MSDIGDHFQRQAEWQKSRARLTWSEKLVLAETLRDAALAMRRKRPDLSSQDEDSALSRR